MNYKPITRVDYLVVHCSATRAGQPKTAADIRRMHLERGWKDIGYHYVIRLDGVVEKGRKDDRPGAHVEGFNSRSLGICLIGGLDAAGKAANTYTPAQLSALADLLRTLRARYPVAEILGHRDLSPDRNKDGKITRNEWVKECPCFDVRSWWSAQHQ